MFLTLKQQLLHLWKRKPCCLSRISTWKKNGLVTATKLGTTNNFFVAATKNFAAVTKRFVDRTKYFVVVTKYFCYPYFNKWFCWHNQTLYTVWITMKATFRRNLVNKETANLPAYWNLLWNPPILRLRICIFFHVCVYFFRMFPEQFGFDARPFSEQSHYYFFKDI